MLEQITINETGKITSSVTSGSLVISKENTSCVLGILNLEEKNSFFEIEPLFKLTTKYLELFKLKKNGLYFLSMTGLIFLQKIEPKLLIERHKDSNPDNIFFLMDEGMLVIGKQKLINDIPNIVDINELDFYRASVYEFIEATFPHDIEKEQQFSYKVPSFYIKIFNKILSKKT